MFRITSDKGRGSPGLYACNSEGQKIMGLEVDNKDIDELLEEHSQELTTEELM